jgi:enoyl-CoA hydratase/carnithine racemase
VVFSQKQGLSDGSFDFLVLFTLFVVVDLGLQRASELALMGDPISPAKMAEWGVVNAIVEPDELIPTAIRYARKICENSPDAVIVSRTAMLMSLERNHPLLFLGSVSVWATLS